jgi:hypothetical protein
VRESWVRFLTKPTKVKVVGRVARMLLRAARLMINEGSGFVCPTKCNRVKKEQEMKSGWFGYKSSKKARGQEEGRVEARGLVLCLIVTLRRPRALDLGGPVSVRSLRVVACSLSNLYP